MYPVSGGFYTYATRFIEPSFGFAMAWNYVLQWAASLPLELTVCAITIQYWAPDVSPGVWIAVFLGAIIILNVFGTLGYAEEEFWAACFKLTSICIFMIVALVLVCGGGPSSGRYDTYSGFKLWQDPGAFKNGFKGFCSVFVTAAFSFAGTELIGLAAAEARNPTESVPKAVKQVFWRICLFYIVALFFIGLLIDCNDESLLSSSSYSSTKASPFVLVGKYSGLKGFDHYMNAVILSAVLSLGIASVYGGSRTLLALAQQGYAPKIFTWIDRAGRPLPSVIFIILFGLLAFLNLDAAGPVIFDWLLALSGLSMLVTWASICVAHIRFRAAWKHNGRSLDEIPFKAIGGVYGSWFGLIFVIIVMMAQVRKKLKIHSQDAQANSIYSSTLLSLPPLESQEWAQLRASSSSTSHSLLCCYSGPEDGSGSEQSGSRSRRSTLTRVDVSTTGRLSVPTAPSWPASLLGSASFIPFSNYFMFAVLGQ
jgi:amino acid transporter